MYKSLGPGMIGLECSFPEAASLASEHGFAAIQVDVEYLQAVGPSDYRSILDREELRNGSAGLPFRFDADEEPFEEGLAQLDGLAETLTEIGCDRLSTWVLSFSDERAYEDNFTFHKNRISRVAAVLEAHDLELALEFLGPETMRAGHEYRFIASVPEMLELCEAIPASNVGVLLDSWHWYTAGNPDPALAALTSENVVDVHVNDAPDRPRSEQIDSERLLPATSGVIEIDRFLQRLADLGYDGPVTVEPFNDELEALSDEAAVAETAESLDRAFQQAAV